jgi:shikimate dehydrogenase
VRAPTGSTRVAGVIGDPVAHSRSPAIHNAAFAATGLDWVYLAFPVPAGEGGAAVRAMTPLGIAGLNVTMPHKANAAAACGELRPTATALGVVNTIARLPDGTIVGDSTDGEGFLRALADDGVEVAGCRVVVLGAGGAARAVVHAVGRAGGEVGVWARRADRARATAALAPTARVVTLDAVATADLVVNATSVGMAAGDPSPVDPDLLHPGQHVVDLIYHPVDTPLLAAARAAGASAANGLGMLVHQAALAFEWWTGVDAPLDAMRGAAAG